MIGNVRYEFKIFYSNGMIYVFFLLIDFISKLVVLVLLFRLNLMWFYGVFVLNVNVWVEVIVL